MSFSNRMNKVAARLLGKFDERSTKMAILKQGAKVWDSESAEYVIGADVKYFMTGVEQTISSGLINGTTIQSGDKTLTVSTVLTDIAGAPVDYIPAVSDKVLIDGSQWSIVATEHADYTGADNIVCYKLQVRK